MDRLRHMQTTAGLCRYAGFLAFVSDLGMHDSDCGEGTGGCEHHRATDGRTWLNFGGEQLPVTTSQPLR